MLNAASLARVKLAMSVRLPSGMEIRNIPDQIVSGSICSSAVRGIAREVVAYVALDWNYNHRYPC
jgi:hypothetical protein